MLLYASKAVMELLLSASSSLGTEVPTVIMDRAVHDSSLFAKIYLTVIL